MDTTPTISTWEVDGVTYTSYSYCPELVPEECVEWLHDAQSKGEPVIVPQMNKDIVVEVAVLDEKGKVLKPAVIEKRLTYITKAELDVELSITPVREILTEEVVDGLRI